MKCDATHQIVFESIYYDTWYIINSGRVISVPIPYYCVLFYLRFLCFFPPSSPFPFISLHFPPGVLFFAFLPSFFCLLVFVPFHFFSLFSACFSRFSLTSKYIFPSFLDFWRRGSFPHVSICAYYSEYEPEGIASWPFQHSCAIIFLATNS